MTKNSLSERTVTLPKYKMRYLLTALIVVITFFNQKIYAQETQSAKRSRFSVTGGWGYYELANIGAQWNYSKRSSISVYGGSNLGLNQNTTWSVGLSFDQVFFKPTDWKIKPGYSVNALYWTNENDLYYFKSISFPIMMLLAYPLSPSLTVRLEGGIVISSTLESDRKQNVEAGYPDRFNGNLRINMVYKLPTK